MAKSNKRQNVGRPSTQMSTDEKRSYPSRKDSRTKRRRAGMTTAASKPSKPAPSHAQASAKISDNKYALLNLLDGEFEDVRQKTLSGKGKAIAQATREAEQKLKRLRKPVSKEVFDSTLDLLGGL